MSTEELSNYLNQPESKKVFKLLDRILRSEGSDILYQNMYYHSGCDLDYYFHPSGQKGSVDIPDSVRVYLDNLYEKITEMDFMNEIECDETSSSIDITFNVKTKTLECDVTTYHIVTSDYSTSVEITDPEMIENLNDWANRGYEEIKIDFNGSGDSGYIESTGYVSGGNSDIQIPASYEDFMYRMLSNQYGGWENNEGGQGTFTILINSQIIELYMGLNEESPEGGIAFKIEIDY